MADVSIRFKQAWRFFDKGQVVDMPEDTAEILCRSHVGIAELAQKYQEPAPERFAIRKRRR
jgi:hypothetical protein